MLVKHGALLTLHKGCLPARVQVMYLFGPYSVWHQAAPAPLHLGPHECCLCRPQQPPPQLAPPPPHQATMAAGLLLPTVHLQLRNLLLRRIPGMRSKAPWLQPLLSPAVARIQACLPFN